MSEEKKLNLEEEEFNLDLEVYEVSSATVLEAMGASNGHNSCSVVKTKH
ncbi:MULTISPECIES: thiopeptide-type bacteriocin [Chengkuizengella]|uniref:Uncharacterized protein n=1 Tax=Chengkuizengella axinellae TaxID=3064388 RepID=A0ABT9ITK2_9BACL|nr:MULTISPECIES: thiopeptide-type bacteriocin [Chengkuizengella]MDP5272676.1 hypothetical protein [Chengkuizengella sp. 2205SS18-9]NDI36719.1 hypothetical protein [Chengkuizengella sediminis]